MAKIIVVGAGLFGSVIAAALRAEKHRVTIIDSGEPYAASSASGCLMRPSWLSSIEKSDQALGYEMLRKLYVLEERMLVNVGLLGAKFKVDFVNPDSILQLPDLIGRVVEVRNGEIDYIPQDQHGGQIHRGKTFKADKVIIAAGFNSVELAAPTLNIPVGKYAMRQLVGLSMRFKGQIAQDSMKVYAPYKQAVAFNINKKEVWFGLGTSILAKNWDYEERLADAIAKAEEFFALKYNKRTTRVDVGARPYVEGHKAGLLMRRDDVWMSTGGAKNGTLLAAVHAAKLVEALK